MSSQVFDDAYKSQLSCVVVDDIERLLGLSFLFKLVDSVCLKQGSSAGKTASYCSVLMKNKCVKQRYDLTELQLKLKV